MENQLIQLYLLVCHCYDNQSSLKYQRASNFKPVCSDQELLTIYLFGHLNDLSQKKAIHRFVRRYWFEWFPTLPSYPAFNRRLNLLEDNFHALFDVLLAMLHRQEQRQTADYLIDSLPIMLACGTRSRRARVAPEIARTGFSAVKQTNFYGVRLHLLAARRNGALPLPAKAWIAAGNVHDLTAVREKADQLPASITLFADKAYASAHLKSELAQHDIKLLTPLKKSKGAELSSAQKKFNQTVSSFRQPIECFFKWLIDKTEIQRASDVRSAEGLLIHCLGKLTVALLLLNFYS